MEKCSIDSVCEVKEGNLGALQFGQRRWEKSPVTWAWQAVAGGRFGANTTQF